MKRLQFLREAQGLTKGEFAKAVYTTRKTIYGLESGRIGANNLHPAIRSHIEAFLGEPLDSLLEQAELRTVPGGRPAMSCDKPV